MSCKGGDWIPQIGDVYQWCEGTTRRGHIIQGTVVSYDPIKKVVRGKLANGLHERKYVGQIFKVEAVKIHYIINFPSRITACGRSILDKECSTKFGRVFWTTIEKDITCRNCLRGNEAERKQQDGK